MLHHTKPALEPYYGSPRLVSVPQAAKMLSLGLTSTWSLITAKSLDVVHIGRRTLVVVASIDCFIELLLTSEVSPTNTAADTAGGRSSTETKN
jgi:hypothetical protein